MSAARRLGRLASRALPLVLAGAGILLFANGAYIPVKAEVAQLLLDRAWEQAAERGENVRPWAWADTWPVARLETPKGQHIVLAGTHGESLAFGPGWDPRGAAPGKAGNVILAGHRDTHFAELEHLEAGQELVLETPRGEVTTYRVVFTSITDRTDTWPLESVSGERWLTLITCYPFSKLAWSGPQRWIVRAVATDTDERTS